MSVEAITWALKQPIPHSSAKFVLVVLANCAAGDTGLAYPSIQYIAEATGQDRKTVIANLSKLRDWKLIDDTGKRVGATAQIVVYRVAGPDLFHQERSQKRNHSTNGTVPKTDRNSAVFPRKESQKRDTEPSEPSVTKESAPLRGSRLPEDWKPSEELMAWAREKFPGVDAIAELGIFRDHWKAAAGRLGIKADWDATFRNWIRKAQSFSRSSAHPQAGSGAHRPYVPEKRERRDPAAGAPAEFAAIASKLGLRAA